MAPSRLVALWDSLIETCRGNKSYPALRSGGELVSGVTSRVHQTGLGTNGTAPYCIITWYYTVLYHANSTINIHASANTGSDSNCYSNVDIDDHVAVKLDFRTNSISMRSRIFHHIVACHNMIHGIIWHCTILYYTTLYCVWHRIQYCIALYCTILSISYDVTLYHIMWYCHIRYYTTLHYTILYSIILY